MRHVRLIKRSFLAGAIRREPRAIPLLKAATRIACTLRALLARSLVGLFNVGCALVVAEEGPAIAQSISPPVSLTSNASQDSRLGSFSRLHRTP
jgi:hypothetical protein